MTSVLIVDDSSAVRSRLRQLFETAGFTVLGEALDGGEGVAAYARLRPDVVTLDVEMRPVDGLTALRRIREADPAARALVITSAFGKAEVLEALSLGAAYVLRKPPRAEKLLEAVRRLLGRNPP